LRKAKKILEMNVNCWKCKGSGLKPVKKKNFKGDKCTVCTRFKPPGLKKHIPLRPFKVPVEIGPKAKFNIDDPSVSPLEDEMLTALAGHWCLYQFEYGHRMTTDDLVCGAIASMQNINIEKYMDLGTGLGSVLHIVNWKRFGEIKECFGIEAQEKNYNLALKSIRFNGIDSFTKLINIDMRDLMTSQDVLLNDTKFDLITGTPPYFPLNNQSHPDEFGRTMCAFEVRGGIEVYIEVAAKYLKMDGRLVIANGYLQSERTLKCAERYGFSCTEIWNVHGRTRSACLFSVFCFKRKGNHVQGEVVEIKKLDIRGEDYQFTKEYEEMLISMGKPPSHFELGTIPGNKKLSSSI
jgi:tRNA1(Val) A37 N6-methylase TrmN6